MDKVLKSSVVVLVSFVTWFSTNYLLAQYQRVKPSAQSASRPQETTQKKVVDAGAAVSAPRPLDSEEFVSGAHLDASSLSVADGKARIAVKATLGDKHQTNSYVWRLALLDAKGKTIDQIVYDQQVFRMEPDGSMEATFEEAVPLTPATRMVQVSLFSFPPGTDLATFLDNELSLGYLLLRSVEKLND